MVQKMLYPCMVISTEFFNARVFIFLLIYYKNIA